MSSFTEPLILEALAQERDGCGVFRVYKAFTYEIGSLGSGNAVTVPAGYDTDLASVPWFARAFIPLAGRLAKPALIHDWLLDSGDERAHDVFAEALQVAKVGWLTRTIVIIAVRAYAKWRTLKCLFSSNRGR